MTPEVAALLATARAQLRDSLESLRKLAAVASPQAQALIDLRGTYMELLNSKLLRSDEKKRLRYRAPKRCGSCGRVGHNVSTCGNLERVAA